MPGVSSRHGGCPGGAGGREGTPGIEGHAREEEIMLWTIVGILVLLWLVGLLTEVGGGLIHLLLVIALIVFVFQLISGRRAV
jgi:hypothetical protein